MTPETTLIVRRTAREFLAGSLAFIIVAACVAVSEGQASSTLAGTSEWVTTVTWAPEPQRLPRFDVWHLAATAVLAITSGALTVFNLSLARHVRQVAASASADRK